MDPLIEVISVFLASLYLAYRINENKKLRLLPPGPPGIPILVNALQLPDKYLAIKLTEWAKTYGEIYSIRAMNQTMIVLSSPEAIREVMDKHGSQTGGRPYSGMLPLVMESTNLLVNEIDTTLWKTGRRYMRDILPESKLDRFLPSHAFESTWLLKDVLNTPKDVYTHILRTTASSIMSTISGTQCLTYSNTIVEKYHKTLHLFNVLMGPNAYPLVNALPIVNYIVPESLAPWKQRAREARNLRHEVDEEFIGPSEAVLGTDNETGCFLETVLKANESNKRLTRDEIAALGGLIMDGGTKTSASLIQSCILSAIKFPECQKKLHDELDRVVGRDRLPVWEDVKDLPYLNAFIEEVMRFRPLFPLAIPHAVTNDLMYKDYLIPKGAILFMNTWGGLSDENLFDQPEQFNPDRFLKSQYGIKEGIDDSVYRNNFLFGAGRRICPGESFGRRTVAINAMKLLWAFRFTKDKSGTGTMDLEAYASGLEFGPLPFTCNAEPRDERCVAVMEYEFSKLTQ